MPAPNDLTPEEEAEFANHGVPSAGPGREPLADQNVEGQQQQGQQQQSQQQDDSQQQGQQRDAHGRFASQQQQQDDGQQQQQQGGQQRQQDDGQQQGVDQRTVPLAALQEERRARQELARRTQLAETRMNAMLSRQQQSGQVPDQMPDIGTDPAGYILKLEERLQRFEQERGETTQNQQLDQAISQDEDTFTQITPDYPQASDYFVQSRAKELLAFHPPQEAQQIMLAEARQIARMAWERGQSVAKTVYDLAQARGYNPEMPAREPAPQQQGQQQQQGQGQQQQQGRGAAIVDSINRGQQASRSLSGGNGSASAESLNASALLDMDDAEFNRWLGEGPEATRRFANIG